MLKWDHWHIEASSICALRCARCPRAEVPDTVLNRSLTLDFFQTQIGSRVIEQIRKITFCGNDGDPIYCKQFLEICAWIKQVNPSCSLVIITNGSYKPEPWWIQLGNILNHHDEIHWSLDGWDQASNNLYRNNSDWDSIAKGMAAFFSVNSSCYRVWAAIGFRFNQHKIDHMQAMAQQLDFDCFQLTKSTKFGSKYPSAYGLADSLEPTDSNLVASGSRYQRITTQLTEKTRPGSALKMLFLQRAKELNQYSGICLIGNKGVFVNSQGEFYPCCWTANRYDHNQKWHGRFNLYQQTFDQIINDSFWQSEFLKFDSLECKTKCARKNLNDVDHISEW